MCLPAFSQDEPAIRLGVSVLSSESTDISDVGLRDEIVKAINQGKAGKKGNIALIVVPLDAPPGGRAILEAQGKDCAYILYIQLKPLQSSTEYQQSFDGMTVQNRGMTAATVEYLVRRLSDGEAYAGGTGKSEPLISPREAIVKAAQNAGERVVTVMATGGNAGSGKLAEVADLDKLTSMNPRDVATPSFCAWLPTDIAHAESLRGACEYARTLPQKMPNFICRQETSRFEGRNKVPTDLITANVRYENGDESYSDFTRNGKPAPEAVARSLGLWSNGQLEANLHGIFHPANHAVLQFSGENQAGDRPAWVFAYRIARQERPVWQLRSNGMVAAPAYSGELWVEQKTGNVLRFTAKANDLSMTFPMQKAEILIDYSNVEFGDGTAFVLPVTSSVATQFRGYVPTRNLVQFRGCHKFRAKARMLISVAGDEADKPVDSTDAANASEHDREQSETIYAILREQAIRDDAALLDAEQQEELKEATTVAYARLAAIEKELRQSETSELASNAPSAPPGSSNESVATFRASAKLVPVSVVVRDGRGRAVGNLTKADFLLFDEHKPQAIGSFSVEKSAAGAQALSGKEERTTAADTQDGPSAHKTSNVAYVFDDIHSTYEDIENARDAATRHVAEMRLEDQAAIFTTSGTVSLDFTADREKLTSALNALKTHARSTQGDCPQMSYYMADLILNQVDRDATSKVIADTLTCTFHGTAKGDPSEIEKAKQLAMGKAFEMISTGRVESENALSLLQEVIRVAARTPGRRSIVLVSPGFLTVDPGAQDKAMALIEQAVQAGVVVNTLDVRGVETTGISATALDLANTGEFERQEVTARNAVMADFAYGTGGVFFHNNNDLALGFRQTADVPEYIYVLGFSPQKLDGKFHKLRVRLNRGEKFTVQARAGYYALKQSQ
jgi:VWFA-related protein